MNCVNVRMHGTMIKITNINTVKQVMYFTWQVFFSNFLPADDSVHDPKLVSQ